MNKKYLVKITKVLADNIKLYRELNGLSAAQLAAKVGVSRQTITEIETEKSWIRVSLIEKLAKEFKIEQHELFQADLKLKKEITSQAEVK